MAENKTYVVEMVRTIKLTRTLIVCAADAVAAKTEALAVADEMGDIDADTEHTDWRVMAAKRAEDRR